jgi:uncharacterized glyoxalase superfamily protein PhnB
MPHLFRVIVPVSDINAGENIYRTVLADNGERISPGRHYFHCQGTILACYEPRADGDERDAKPLPEPIYIAVEDLESTYELARSAGARFSKAVIPGVGPVGEIAVRPWGERSFYADDPFGNPLCFVDRNTMFTTHL